MSEVVARPPRVLDASRGLPGAYAALLLHQAGAEVVRAEPSGGDPLRTWWHGEGEPGGEGALFRYLRQGQVAVLLGDGTLAAALADVGAAEVVLASPVGAEERAAVRDLRVSRPDLVVVALTPWGLDGPYADRPATDFTLHADSGALAIRGPADRAPYQAGGRANEWLAGAFAAAGALGAWEGRRHGGPGTLVDLSVAEVHHNGCANFMDTYQAILGGVGSEPAGPPRVLETPSIERTADGWVGFNTNAPYQATNFLRMIGRDDLADAGDFALPMVRHQRIDEWQALIDGWVGVRTSAEVIEAAVAHKVPVAPVCDGRTVAELDHVQARRSLVRSADGTFVHPGRPWRLDGEAGPAPAPAPDRPTEVSEGPRWSTDDRLPSGDGSTLPLAGLKVVDLTTWWAGPMASALLAHLGADVVHLESPARMDGVRMVGATFFDRPDWHELSWFFLAINGNKRDLALDLQGDQGHRLALDLIAQADVVVENATPHVLDKLGLGRDAIRAVNPRAILVRMPAFGLDGPWRDRPGFAQNIEQASGLAWLTGEAHDQPRIQRGPPDPNGGLHAAVALFAMLQRRDRTGEGGVVEASMFEPALALASEAIVEWSAYGRLLARDGNRSATAAPQGLYAAAGEDRWLAVSCETDEQWRALARAIDRDDLAADPALADLAGRRRDHDRLDEALAAWAADREADDAADRLAAAGVPAAPARDPRASGGHPQFQDRHYQEVVDHPVAGSIPVPTLPFRFDGVGRWIRTAPPCFGQDNDAVLGEWLGLDPGTIAGLRADGVIADRPAGP